jgi:hypothetical protein
VLRVELQREFEDGAGKPEGEFVASVNESIFFLAGDN